MATNAKQRFDDVMVRCDSLVTQSEGSSMCDELLRYAVVLAVSALDMYAGDRFAEKFVSVLKDHAPDDKDVKFLEKIGVGMKDILELLRETPQRPYRRMRTLVDEYLSHSSLQSQKKINDLYAYFGLSEITKNAIGKSGRKKLDTAIEQLLKRRHAIVHGCDYNGMNTIQKITEKTVKRWLRSLRLLVGKMEETLSDRFPQ